MHNEQNLIDQTVFRLHAKEVDADSSDGKHASKQQRQLSVNRDVKETSVDVVLPITETMSL